jgi:hypothetical protein
MSVFQSLVFDTTVLDGITDPAVRARVWAECFEQIHRHGHGVCRR